MINHAAERAVYRQIADELRARIQSGQLRPGDDLPSVRHLAQEYGVGTDTIQRTMDVLRNEGLIGTVRGYPAWVVEERDRIKVSVPRGAEFIARMPTDAERTELGIEPGIVVPIVVVMVGGRERGKYAADRTRFTFS
ncbi:winged helix-turn-helix domain-containing protein [Micromonospora taraxaci]|uniref:GntR family transcriptional regulator n=1 Tax=Micromonospora taraxaci TaxID=1316803 RepID=UPI0033F5DE01